MDPTPRVLARTLRILMWGLVAALTLPAAVEAGPPKPFNAVLRFDSTTTGVGACSTQSFTLPVGTRIALDAIQVDFNSSVRLSHEPRASLGLYVKTADGSALMEIGIPLDSESGFGGAAGRRPLDMVATGNLLENAKVGDIFSARMCLNRGAAPFGSATVLLSGHR